MKIAAWVSCGVALALSIWLVQQAPALPVAAKPQAVSVIAPDPVVACPAPVQIPVGSTAVDDVTGSDSSQIQSQVVSAGEIIEVPGGRLVSAPVAAALDLVIDGDIAGLAGVNCGPPQYESFLLGGSTAVGNSARLVLVNPHGAPAAAVITVFGPLGEEAETTVVVPPLSSESKLLEAVAPDLRAVAVHVASSGASISAYLQDSRLDGFMAAGTDWVSGSQLATDLAIPRVGGEGAQEVTLRLFSPTAAAVRVYLFDHNGEMPWTGRSELMLGAGEVTEVSIPVTEAAAISLTSDQPIAAAARTVWPRAAAAELGGRTLADFYWSVAQPVAAEHYLTPLVPGGSHLVFLSPVATKAVISSADGAQLQTVTIPAGKTVTVPTAPHWGDVLQVDTNAVFNQFLQREDGLVSVLEPVLQPGETIEVEILPRAYYGAGKSALPLN